MENNRQFFLRALADAQRGVVAAQRARFIAQRNLDLFDNREVEMTRFYEDCHTAHPQFRGYHLMWSPEPHIERYTPYCVICGADFQYIEMILLTGCKHVFHTNCIA
jgi:hypothetical protein